MLKKFYNFMINRRLKSVGSISGILILGSVVEEQELGSGYGTEVVGVLVEALDLLVGFGQT